MVIEPSNLTVNILPALRLFPVQGLPIAAKAQVIFNFAVGISKLAT